MATKHLKWGIAFALVMVAAGCTSLDESKFGNQVKRWVPVGTSEKDAERIMAKHGFDCTLVKANTTFNGAKTDCLDCIREWVYQHTWTAQIQLTDDKVSGYGRMTVE